jgi:protein MPE1
MVSVFYKYRPLTNQGISGFDVKREIMNKKQLGKGLDLDLEIFNASSNQELSDDTIIPRNTQIIVKRLPPAGIFLLTLGKQGTAQRYMIPQATRQIQTGPIKSSVLVNNRPTMQSGVVAGASSTSDEISNLFKATDESWDVQQRSLATHRPVYRPQVAKPGGGGYAGRPAKEGEDAGYICFRCGKSGHYLNMCPTNGDVAFDGPRLKKTTGIPKMFLKTVKREDAEGKNVMVTADGDLVVAQPNE